jgi:ATP-dependent DNA helicase RecQ
LTYLELEGVIIPEGPFYGAYRVQLLRSFEDVLAGHDRDRQEFLKRLFGTAEKGRIWHTFDLAESAFALGEEEVRIRKAIGYIGDMGDAIVKPSKLRHAYRLAEDHGESVASLAAMLTERFDSREKGEIERLRRVVDLCETPRCIPEQLLSYFGESTEPCGRCGVCLGEHSGGSLPASERKEIDFEMTEKIREIHSREHPALRQPRQLARFLCGLSSPATTRARLHRTDEFGLLAEVPFSDVLGHVETL